VVNRAVNERVSRLLAFRRPKAVKAVVALNTIIVIGAAFLLLHFAWMERIGPIWDLIARFYDATFNRFLRYRDPCQSCHAVYGGYYLLTSASILINLGLLLNRHLQANTTEDRRLHWLYFGVMVTAWMIGLPDKFSKNLGILNFSGPSVVMLSLMMIVFAFVITGPSVKRLGPATADVSTKA